MDAARLAASMATSERTPEDAVVDSASACIVAMPSIPTATMISATITSIRLKPPAYRAAAGCNLICVFMCWLILSLAAGRQRGRLLHGDIAHIGDLKAAGPRGGMGRIVKRQHGAAVAAH